jgi:phosphoribosylglycinamide formyltransferase-1
VTQPARARIVVLASGGGSNFDALAAHLGRLGDARRADIVAVASDRRTAGALARARERGIEAVHLQTPQAPDGEPLDACLTRLRTDLVVLAGYLRLVPDAVVAAYHGRMLNVHPALLPAFGGPGMYGARVHQAVLDAGARVSGPTAHFVDEVFDHGAIIAQWPVPVHAADTPASLAARVLRAEHALYPRVVHAVAAGAVSLGSDGRVVWAGSHAQGDMDFALHQAGDAPLDTPATHDAAPAIATLHSLYPNL